MTIDYKKPIRLRNMGVIRSVEYLCHLRTGKGELIAVKLSYSGEEHVASFPPSHLENIPESRWLNVYVNSGIATHWWLSREAADGAGKYNDDRIAVIEDKQDGSPWILHQL